MNKLWLKRIEMFCVFLMFSLGNISRGAGTTEELLLRVEEAYKVGRWNEIKSLLKEDVIKEMDEDSRVAAYKYLTLYYLEIEDDKNARRCADRMLSVKGYYTPSISDPYTLTRLLSGISQKQAQLYNSSTLKELQERVVAPNLIITKRMIDDINAKTLKDVLLTYVPGIIEVSSPIEGNMAMRGVYGILQQKILILQDGYPTNNLSTGSSDPFFYYIHGGIKQIEVYYGPSSADYGGNAYSAIINIVRLLSDKDYQAFSADVGVGSYGEKLANLSFERLLYGMYISSFLSVYTSEGEKRFVDSSQAVGKILQSNGNAYLGGHKSPLCYTFGCNVRAGKFSLNFESNQQETVAPFVPFHSEVSSAASLYDYSKYKPYEGQTGPGYEHVNTAIRLEYSSLIGEKNSIIASFEYNGTEHSYLSPLSNETLHKMAYYGGYWSFINWNETNFIFASQFSHLYGSSSKGGTFTAGFEIKDAEITGQSFSKGFNYKYFDSKYDFLPEANEWFGTFFVQNRYNYSKDWTFNLGARLDYKHRYDGKELLQLSPRLSLNYVPTGKQWSSKLCYSRSMTDAPYLLRYVDFMVEALSGNKDLKPEKLHSIQLNASYKPFSYLSLGGTLFYNIHEDLIYYNPRINTLVTSLYKNIKNLQICGLEATASLDWSLIRAYANLSWIMATRSEGYPTTGTRIHNIPALTTNLTIIGDVLKHKKYGNLSLHTTLHLTSSQLSPIYKEDRIYIGGKWITDPNREVPARCIVDVGMNYTWNFLNFKLQCNNLFNLHYEQGGATILPYLQPGRWFTMKLGVKF